MLEPAKGQSALVKVLLRLRGIEAKASDEIIHPPVFPVLVHMVVKPLGCRQKVQRQPGVRHAAAQIRRHRADIGHQADRIPEHIAVDLLEHIFRSGIGSDL